MFVPDTLDFYPQLIAEGPLKRQVQDIVRAMAEEERPDHATIEGLISGYSLARYDLMATFLRGEGLGWCDLCHKLVPAFSVRTVYRYGSYVTFKTDCTYGDPFPVSNAMGEVKAVCALHGEQHDDRNRISFAIVDGTNGRLIATVDGQPMDVTASDQRGVPSDAILTTAGILQAFAEAVPPELALDRRNMWNQPADWYLVMKDNPYVVIAIREES